MALPSRVATRFGGELKRLLFTGTRCVSTTAEKCLPYSSSNIPSTYGGRHTITLIPAHGIGPALVGGVRDVFVTAGVPVDFHEAHLEGKTTEERFKSFEDILLAVRRNGIAIKGSWITEMGPGDVSFNVALRHQLDLYANVVQCKTQPGVVTRHKDIDLIIVRENTEGEYTNLEHENIPGVVEMLKIVTRKGSQRIARFAFEFARSHGRKKVTCIHKANIMKISDGLFLQCCREVALEYPDIEFNDMIVDNMAMQMVSKPQQFDVMVMPNLYGNIATNIAASLVGGPGIPAGANHGDNIHIYESGTRNSGRGIAHLNIANPMSILLTSVHMLDFLGLDSHARIIEQCCHNIVTSGRARTEDIGGTTKSSEFFNILMEEIEQVRQGQRAMGR